MSHGAFIAGDWGTSHLRLTLCDARGTALDHVGGPGVAQVHGRFDTLFSELTAPWHARHGALPAVLCGMVGSSLGWQNVPYTICPAAPASIAGDMAAVANGSILIAPGLSCRNRHAAPDVMRGEETQILGALHIDARLTRGRHLLCLPGTHTKWVVLDDGVIREFLTSATGELFAIVNRHSVLVRGNDGPADSVDAAFLAAMRQVKQYPQAALTSLLFECRSRQLAGELTAEAAPDFLSGLLITHDVVHATRTFSAIVASAPVTLIGTPQLMRLHAQVLTDLQLPVQEIDGAQASLAGLTSLYRARFGQEHRA